MMETAMSNNPSVPELLTGGFVFAEGPRWHGDKLWLSDMHGESVWTVELSGQRELVVDLPGRRPSGLGFLPNGDLLIVSMLERQILRWNGSELGVHADVSDLIASGCNDMVVDGDGRAYVGSFPPPSSPDGQIVLVEPDGTARLAADDVVFPNGTVITPDGMKLIVAESLGRRLTEFAISADGSLTDRRMYADCPGRGPDGICLDEEGAVWAAMPLARQFQRILPGGAIANSITVDERMAIACALGGPDRTTLFLLTANDHAPEALRGTRDSQIHIMTVPDAGAGLP
jgi:sugar lactone lactonase YvrE